MPSKLKILFKYSGFFFIGHVECQTNNDATIYSVQYALFDSPSELDNVQIYRGKGKDERVCWRQRVDEINPQLKDPEIIELIGKAIQDQENKKSG